MNSEDTMREFLAHEDQYACIILCNDIAKIVGDSKKTLEVLKSLHDDDPAVKRVNLRNWINAHQVERP